jgi:hypothetical protein
MQRCIIKNEEKDGDKKIWVRSWRGIIFIADIHIIPACAAPPPGHTGDG